MNNETIEELDQRARGYINGEVDRLGILSLPPFDKFYVMTLAGVFSCTKVGTMSQKECTHFKYKVATDYRQMRDDFSYSELNHKTWVENTRKYSGKSCEIAKEIRSETPDVFRLICLLCEMIDLLTKENILHQLFLERVARGGTFLKDCMQVIYEHGDAIRERVGESLKPEIMPVLLEKFYQATAETGLDRVYSSLDADNVKAQAFKGIPIKKDSTRDVAEGFRKMYQNGYKKG